MARYIDLTPTWPEAARIIAAALENGTGTGREAARAELYRMADLLAHFASEPTPDAAPRFDVLASFASRTTASGVSVTLPAFGQSFATEQDANAYAARLTAHGYAVEILPAVEAVTAADALSIAADHFGHPELTQGAGQ